MCKGCLHEGGRAIRQNMDKSKQGKEDFSVCIVRNIALKADYKNWLVCIDELCFKSEGVVCP